LHWIKSDILLVVLSPGSAERNVVCCFR